MGIVYHGSPVVGLKTLTPHQSTHGNYVYATKEKLVALILSGSYSCGINPDSGSDCSTH